MNSCFNNTILPPNTSSHSNSRYYNLLSYIMFQYLYLPVDIRKFFEGIHDNEIIGKKADMYPFQIIFMLTFEKYLYDILRPLGIS